MKFRSTWLRAVGALALAGLLASCGGSSLVAFVPGRVLVFGDQASFVATDGRKYNINALKSDGTTDCTTNPLWFQILAASYGMFFPQCPGTTTGTQASRILAQFGATAGGAAAADLPQQITSQLQLAPAQGGGIGSSDLVTVFVGVNDIVAAYTLYEAGTISAATAQAQAEAAGVAIATQVGRIATAGGKVVVVTVPDVGATPFGRSRPAANAALLTFLTTRVNAVFATTLENTGFNDGRKIALIELNPYLISVLLSPSSYGYVDVVNGACVPADTLTCTTSTLKTNAVCKVGATAVAGDCTWLWASDTQLSPGGHRQLGNLATSRAHNQPF